MKIRSLQARDFRGVSNCSIELGSGLNVIFGPNDLGKWTLVQALRSAFLLPATSTRGTDLQPWSGGGTPTVIVEFDEAGESWRLTKQFTGSQSGKATLQCIGGGGVLETKAEGRAVDGKLRELLTWGLPTPGGKKQTTRSSYLVTALLAEQGKVDSILHSSLEDDPLSSGRELVTSSLNAVGRDPLVEQLFERLTTDLETDLSSEQRRETKLHAARSERLELETRRRSLRDALERWANVETKAAMLARREATLDEARARVARVAVDLQVNDEATEGLRGEVAKLEALADACELVEVRAELASVNERADAVRAERVLFITLIRNPPR